MILGHILSMIGNKPLDTLLRQKVLGPMGLTDTTATVTSAIPSPALHSFSSERRVALGIPPTGSFYEEATYWNTQWETPIGANETTPRSVIWPRPRPRSAPAPCCRGRANGGIPALPEDLHRSRRDPLARRVRLTGQLYERERPPVPIARQLHGSERSASTSAKLRCPRGRGPAGSVACKSEGNFQCRGLSWTSTPAARCLRHR